MSETAHLRQHQVPEHRHRRTYVHFVDQLCRLLAYRCPRCNVLLSTPDGWWWYCPCCERRYRPEEPDDWRRGWREERITRIIGRCGHGA